MNNDIGDRAEKSMQFGEMIGRRTGLEVVMWDERLNYCFGRADFNRE